MVHTEQSVTIFWMNKWHKFCFVLKRGGDSDFCKEQKLEYFALPFGKKEAKTSSYFLDITFLSKEHLKFTRTDNLLKNTQCLPKGKHFILKDEFMNWKKKKKPFCFKVIKTFIQQGNKVIEMIKGACTSKKM